MDGRPKELVELGYKYGNRAIEYLKKAIPEQERQPLDMAVFSGGAAAVLLATAYKNVRGVKRDAKEAREWLAAVLGGAVSHISEDSGFEVKILLVEKGAD